MHNDPDFPQPGAKVVFKKAQEQFWFTDIIKNAKDNLVKGNTYTLKTVDIASSWVEVTLEETGDIPYALSFFTY